MQHEELNMQQQLLIKKMQGAEGKVFLILYIEYLERFTTNKLYSSIEELLRQQDLHEDDVVSLLSVLYEDKDMDISLRDKILDTF